MPSVAYTWGSTPAERAMPFPCDRYLAEPDDALLRAVDVAAPPATVLRWLCQLRAAPYSYDWIDNWGRQSPRTLTQGLARLAVGQRVMTIFELVEFEPDRHLTLLLRSGRPVFGDIAGTYGVVASGAAGSRLMVKLLVRYPAGLSWLTRRVLPWGDLVMMRKHLLTLKALAEGVLRGECPRRVLERTRGGAPRRGSRAGAWPARLAAVYLPVPRRRRRMQRARGSGACPAVSDHRLAQPPPAEPELL